MRWLKRLSLTLLTLALLLGLTAWWALHASLALLDGEAAVAGLSAPATLERDERGYIGIAAGSRLDAARALGYAHAQERFFQMDLLRRNAAGELAELVGAQAVDLDKSRRWHRFRARSTAWVATLPAAERALVQSYVAGVNAGLAALGGRPPEYWLLRQSPKPWQEADSLLVLFSMYLDLQGAQGRDDLATGWAKAQLPPEWFSFLTQHSADWQAALDDSRVEPVPVPSSPWPALLRRSLTACANCDGPDARHIGSNNFAVAASRSTQGRAILADDMHLGLRVPGTWFKARLQWQAEGRRFDLAGVTLPGAPILVAGSNGRIAWGFTNTTADWADVIRLKLNAAGTHYFSGGVEKPLIKHIEKIALPGGETIDFEVRESEWGPVMPGRAPAGEAFVLRWVAHDREGANLAQLRLETAGNVDEAVRAAVGAGTPAQNLLLADSGGRIAWTVLGAMPRRAPGTDADAPQDWSDGVSRWQGYRQEHPAVVDPADGRLWSANARTVGGQSLQIMGHGGYDLGARGQQIRDGLRALDKTDEAGLHAIQLDHRALFLQRWQRLLLDQVLTPEFVAREGLAEYRVHVASSAEAARIDAVGYLLVREFRIELLRQIFAPLAAQLEAQGLRLRDVKMSTETPGWALLQAARPDTLPAGVNSWPELLHRAVLTSRAALIKKHGSLDRATWGAENPSGIKHPLSQALPGLGAWLGAWLNMPQDGLAGDNHMPRVAYRGHGQSQRFVVSPGHEAEGIMTVPGGQSGHPLSPFYRADHAAWLRGEALPFLPGPTRHRLLLRP